LNSTKARVMSLPCWSKKRLWRYRARALQLLHHLLIFLHNW